MFDHFSEEHERVTAVPQPEHKASTVVSQSFQGLDRLYYLEEDCGAEGGSQAVMLGDPCSQKVRLKPPRPHASAVTWTLLLTTWTEQLLQTEDLFFHALVQKRLL